MHNNTNNNIKIRPIYKTLVLSALFALVGCRPTHKNVIVDIKDVDNKKVFLIHDVKTDAERFFTVDYSPHIRPSMTYSVQYYLSLKSLVVGDTVGVKKIRATNYRYARTDVLENGDYELIFNKDSVFTRQERNRMYQNSVKLR